MRFGTSLHCAGVLTLVFDMILSEVADQDEYSKVIAASDLPDGPVFHVSSVNAPSGS